MKKYNINIPNCPGDFQENINWNDYPQIIDPKSAEVEFNIENDNLLDSKDKGTPTESYRTIIWDISK